MQNSPYCLYLLFIILLCVSFLLMLHIRKRKSVTQKTKVADEKGDSDETWTIIIIIIIEHMCIWILLYRSYLYSTSCGVPTARSNNGWLLYMLYDPSLSIRIIFLEKKKFLIWPDGLLCFLFLFYLFFFAFFILHVQQVEICEKLGYCRFGPEMRDCCYSIKWFPSSFYVFSVYNRVYTQPTGPLYPVFTTKFSIIWLLPILLWLPSFYVWPLV